MRNRLIGATALLLFFAQPGIAWAQGTASDVVCNKCVDTSDVASGAITSLQIQNRAVNNADIELNTIDSSRIKDGSVTIADTANGTITERTPFASWHLTVLTPASS